MRLVAQDGMEDSARDALRQGNYPWYDATTDDFAPVQLPWNLADWLAQWFGRWRLAPRSGPSVPMAGFDLFSLLVLLLFVLAAVLLVVGLVWARRWFEPDAPVVLRARRGGVARVEDGAWAPDDLPTVDDAWAEACRRRASGDLAAAVVYLFIDMVRTLDRLGLARPAPGRTGRQIVRSVTDAQVRRRIEPTLGLFEALFYGHRPPTPEPFEAAWAEALRFRERMAVLAAEGGRS